MPCDRVLLTFNNAACVELLGCVLYGYKDGAKVAIDGIRPCPPVNNINFVVSYQGMTHWRWVGAVNYSDKPENSDVVMIDTGIRLLTKCTWTITCSHSKLGPSGSGESKRFEVLEGASDDFALEASFSPSGKAQLLSVGVPVSIINQSSVVVRADGNVGLKDTETQDAQGARFGRILPGQQETKTVSMQGYPEIVLYHFEAEDGSGDWNGGGTATNAPSVRITLTD